MRVMATARGYCRPVMPLVRAGRDRSPSATADGRAPCEDGAAMASTSTSPYSTRFKVVAVIVLALAIAAVRGRLPRHQRRRRRRAGDVGRDRQRHRRAAASRRPTARCRSSDRRHRPAVRLGGHARAQRGRDPDGPAEADPRARPRSSSRPATARWSRSCGRGRIASPPPSGRSPRDAGRRPSDPLVLRRGLISRRSSPVSRSLWNPASSSTGTPSSSALVTFDAPGPSPTTTAVVFPDTLPGDLPPRALMAASASSRVKPSSVPVTTTRHARRAPWARCRRRRPSPTRRS